MSNLIKVEQPFGYDPPAVYCPACGSPIYTPDEMSSCKHLLYAWMSESGFDYVAPAIESLVEKLEEDADVDDPLSELQSKIDNEHVAIIDLHFGGMACGPVSFNDVYGFDFNTTKEDD
jgi:hypothetical protein